MSWSLDLHLVFAVNGTRGKGWLNLPRGRLSLDHMGEAKPRVRMSVRSFFAAVACSLAMLPATPVAAAATAAGGGSKVVPEVLMDLGAIQRRTGELDEAQSNYETAIDEIEHQAGYYDPRLVKAFSGLAAVLHDRGEYDGAVKAADRAVYVSRVNEGLHNLKQVPLLEQATESLVAMGDVETASDKQAYAFSLLRRAYGLDNIKIVPGLYRLASWYRRIGDVYVARSLYEHAVDVLESSYGPDDVHLVPALQGIATTYRLERFPMVPAARESEATLGGLGTQPLGVIDDRHRVRQVNRYGEGERALKRTVLILDKSEKADPAARAKAIVDLGDWYLLFEKWSKALDTYAAAQQVIAADAATAARMDEFFGEPKPLYFPLPHPGTTPYTEEKSGYIDVEYDVSERGEVQDVRVTAADPPGLMDFRMRHYVRLARFRPKFEKGTPVAVEGLTYRHNFVYSERDEQ